MRAAISEACTAEPPGELMATATATMPLRWKARSRTSLTALKDRPVRNGVTEPIVPLSLITGTTGTLARQGGGTNRLRKERRAVLIRADAKLGHPAGSTPLRA